MKKFLLLATSALLVSSSMTAMKPTVYPGMAFNGLSPNGNYAVSITYGALTIFDFQADKSYDFLDEYTGGNGNYVSNTGIVVGSKLGFDSACLFQNGEWQDLPGIEDHVMSFANGITSNGSRIVGNVTPPGLGEINYDGLMLVPCYWDLGSDGKYSQPVLLPHPDTDFAGRTPQYITAVRVSEDGKTIAGQIQDYSGFTCQPILYTQDASGEWTYTLLLNDLFHPEGIHLPEDPGEAPSTDPKDFMTEEELAAYNQALQEWENDCLESGDWDYENYPNYEDYLSEEGKAALAKAEEEYELWQEKFDAYEMAFQELCSLVPAFEFNNVFLSTDAKYCASTDAKSQFDFETWTIINEYTPYLLDISDLTKVTYTTYPNEDISIIISTLADDGTMLGQAPNEDMVPQAYILTSGSDEFVSLYEVMNTLFPEIGKWMKDNMTHTYMAIDYETFELEEKTALFSGIPFSTPDLSLFAFGVENLWDDVDNEDAEDAEPYYPAYGYIFSANLAGVESVETVNSISINTLPNATIALTGDVDDLKIYNISGTCVLSVEKPGNTIATGLNHGIYVVKAMASDGRTYIKKVVL